MKPLTLALVVGLAVSNASAFEFGTHATITAKAWDRFIGLDENSTLLVDLGLIKPTGSVFNGERYRDLKGSALDERKVHPFEEGIMTTLGYPTQSLPSWIMRGAIREDDDAGDKATPQDDPNGPMHRVFNHFYDPYNSKALTVLSQNPCELNDIMSTSCLTAVDWALGTVNFKSSTQFDTGRRNHFSLADAREWMYRALTGHSGGAFIGVTGLDAATRAEYWESTFRALGDVLHLNQDMAQPQHTRNDSHAGVFPTWVTGHKSAFEQFVEASVIGKKRLVVKGDTSEDGIPYTPAPLQFDGYPSVAAGSPPDVVRFAKYSEYWTESSNKGLADYTNRGFFTVGTNLDSISLGSYPLPDRIPEHYAEVSTPAVHWDGTPVGPSLGASPTTTFLAGQVPDAYSGAAAFSIKLSAKGSWNDFLSSASGGTHYALYRDNYVDQASLVLPRAVGYSAGLLNHFFRGRLTISLPPEEVYRVADFAANIGFQDFKVMVANESRVKLSDGTFVHQNVDATGNGTLVAVLRYRTNTCFTWPTLEGSPHWDPVGPHSVVWNKDCRSPSLDAQYLPNIKVSTPVTLSADIDSVPQPIIFHFDEPLPFSALDVDLQVVYRGPLGSESDDIAVGMEQISEPTFYDFVNFADCQMQVPQTCQDDACTWTGTAHLPAPEATPAPGQYDVVGVTKLPKGHYARAAFLTRSGMREQVTQLEPVTNEQYDYVQPVEYPDGEVDTWGPGEVIRSPLYSGRLLQDHATPPGFHPMMTWWSQGMGNTNCYGDNLSLCNMGVWASQSCGAATPPDWTPYHVDIYFLGQPQT